MNIKKTSNNLTYLKGFTFIELMIVVSIITFLVILVISILNSQTLKGNDAKRKTDIQRISIAIEEYEKDNNCYPPANLVTCTPTGTGLKPYLEKIACDPTTKTSYYYETDGTTCSAWYRLYTDLQNTKDSAYQAGIGPSGSFSYVVTSPNAPNFPSIPGPGPSVWWGYIGGICKQIAVMGECSPSYDSESNCNLYNQHGENPCIYP